MEKLRYPYESDDAKRINKDVFETIYFGAMEASIDLARELGPYASYEGSPTSQGLFQFDLWNVKPSDRWDWEGLRARLGEHGCRNSLLLAPMPTASTAQILGNNESFEPFTSNMYTRRVLAGEFAVVNKYLLQDLIARGLWTSEIRNQIIADKGSVQGVAAIPDDLKALQDDVGDKAEVRPRHVRGPRRVHLPVPVPEPPHRGPEPGQAHVHALLRLEEGPQDGHVLPPHAAQGRRHRLHRGPGHGGQEPRRRRAQARQRPAGGGARVPLLRRLGAATRRETPATPATSAGHAEESPPPKP